MVAFVRAVLKKQEIANRFGLAYRDLRALDTVLRNMPSILARQKAILVNLELTKAIITPEGMLVFEWSSMCLSVYV